MASGEPRLLLIRHGILQQFLYQLISNNPQDKPSGLSMVRDLLQSSEHILIVHHRAPCTSHSL